MSEDKYTEITVGYFNSLLNVLKEKTVGTAESPFRVIFISGNGADSTEKSRTLFARVKVGGRTDTRPPYKLMPLCSRVVLKMYS